MGTLPWIDDALASVSRSLAGQRVAAPDRVIADRYRLLARADHAEGAETWQAHDELSGDVVAVTLLPADTDDAARREGVRRLALLRVLRLPGVEALRDVGSDGPWTFTVTSLATGARFPDRPVAWAELATTLRGLLETLASLHALGITHGDLSVANVDVAADGRPTLLELGAPTAAAASVAVDLASLGAMLARACDDAPPLVTRVISTLAHPDPTRRPVSADAILAALAPAFPPPALPPALVDSLFAATVHELVARLRSGESVDLVGPPASGRSSCVARVATVLRDSGLPCAVVHTRSDLRRPRIGDALASGAVLVVDPKGPTAAASLDAALEHLGVRGPVLSVRTSRGRSGPAVALAAHDELSLRALFAGPDRLLHLPSDAAHLLWARTRGLPGRVLTTLDRWLRAGAIHAEGDRLRITRPALDALASAFRLSAASPTGLSASTRAVFAAAVLADDHATEGLLAAALGRPARRVARALDTLGRRHLLEPRADGSWRPPRGRGALVSSDRAVCGELHARLAAKLPAGSEARLWQSACAHFNRSTDAETFAADLAASARASAERGRIGPGIDQIEDGWLLLRATGSDHHAASLEVLQCWAELALVAPSAERLGRVRYALTRARPSTPAVTALILLVDAARDLETDPSRAMLSTQAVPRFVEPLLERQRLALRARVSRSLSPGEGARLLDRIVAEVPPGDTETRLSLESSRAFLAYRDGRFAEAALLHARIARESRGVQARLTATLACASSWMEGFAFGRAREAASLAMDLAARARSTDAEARAAWMVRWCDYRAGEVGEVDRELLRAVEGLAAPSIEAPIVLTEAAVAWRAGAFDEARELAARARRLHEDLSQAASAMLARCLAIAAGAAADDGELAELFAAALDCDDARIGVQAVGMLSPAVDENVLLALARRVPEKHWNHRMEVISVAEALRRCRVRTPQER